MTAPTLIPMIAETGPDTFGEARNAATAALIDTLQSGKVILYS
jgi:hypothetical protein